MRRTRQSHPDVQFGNGYLDPQCRELFKVLDKGTGNLANDQMSLDTNTVNRNAGGFEGLDKIDHRGGFGSSPLDVVVINLSPFSE